jgi:hypothetical protein
VDDLEELKLLIAANLDVYELLDVLGIDMTDLCDILEEQIEENESQLRRIVR